MFRDPELLCHIAGDVSASKDPMDRSKSCIATYRVRAVFAVALILNACVGAHPPGTPRSESLTGETAPAIPTGTSRTEDEREIRGLIVRYAAAANARDLRAVMRLYAATDTLLVYDISNAPFRGSAEVTRDWEQFMTAMRAINLEFREIEITVDAYGNFAYATFIERASVTPVQGAPFVNDDLRTTQIFEKVNGNWLIIHEHKSKAQTR